MVPRLTITRQTVYWMSTTGKVQRNPLVIFSRRKMFYENLFEILSDVHMYVSVVFFPKRIVKGTCVRQAIADRSTRQRHNADLRTYLQYSACRWRMCDPTKAPGKRPEKCIILDQSSLPVHFGQLLSFAKSFREIQILTGAIALVSFELLFGLRIILGRVLGSTFNFRKKLFTRL